MTILLLFLLRIITVASLRHQFHPCKHLQKKILSVSSMIFETNNHSNYNLLYKAAGNRTFEEDKFDVISQGRAFDFSRPGQNRLLASSGILTLVVGSSSGVAGSTGNNGAASAALVSAPAGIFLDSSANFYFADSGNHVIRKVTSSSGVITSVAGTGVSGSTIGNSATSSLLNAPLAVVLTSSGTNMLIADTGNNCIRRVVISTNVMTTIAGLCGQNGASGDGGQAAAAKFRGPTSVCLDPNEQNLYIADYVNHNVRVMSTTTGIITRFAGGGNCGASLCGDGGPASSSELNAPQGVSVTAGGVVLIADTANNVIRAVSLSLIITTIAGTGTVGSTGNGGAATSAALNTPYMAVMDSSSNIYIADYGNRCVRMVSSLGVITNFAGTSAVSGMSGVGGAATSALMVNPLGVAVDSSGAVLITDHQSNRILYVPASASTNQPTTQPTIQPSRQPTTQPSRQPTSQPSSIPTIQPSRQPTIQPSRQPTSQPSSIPTIQPSRQPTIQPSRQPTSQPSSIPTIQPTIQPTTRPTRQPSNKPSNQPTLKPSAQPTKQPFTTPSSQPSAQPTIQPSSQPSFQPTIKPSNQPSNQPTTHPSKQVIKYATFSNSQCRKTYQNIWLM